MNLALTAEARAFRRAVGVAAWAVLEELVLEADADTSGTLVVRTNVRRLAAQLGMSKDTAARAISRLTRAGVVRRVVGERGVHGALPSSSYVLDLGGVSGLTVDVARASNASPAITSAPSQPAPPPRTRPALRMNASQPSLFDLPSSNAS